MGKDLEGFKVISKLFTEETVKNILINATGCEKIQIKEWNLEATSSKGDSYLSTISKLNITGVAGGEEKNINVYIKSLPQNLGRRKTYRSTDFFYNEIIFYIKIMPLFKEFLKAKNQTDLLLVPECYAYVLDGENDFIVLEDVSVHGFTPAARQNILTLDECKVILRAMARFHGVSFAYKSQNEKKFYEAADQLKETYFSDEHWDWYKAFHGLAVSIAKDAMSKEYGGTPEEKKFSKLQSPDLWKKSVEVCSRQKTPSSVINQGDAWAPNFLIRTLEPSGEKQALLLDFQLARCAGPISDLSFFIYNCTDAKGRDEYFDYILEYYYEELSKTISILGSDPAKVYSKETFMKDVREEFGHGMNFALESMPLSMLDDTELFDLDAIKGDDAIDIVDVWKLKPLKTKEKRQRLANVIMHAMKNGFF